MDDNGIDVMSACDVKEKPSRKTTVCFVKENKSKENQEAAAASKYSDDEFSRVEVEGNANIARQKSSSWRFPAMFSKSQGNSKPDKGPSKQSVFPSSGNILKKKARTTILSVLTKRQAQEKLFLGEKTDGREQQNSTVSSLDPSLQVPKWSSEAMIVDLATDLEKSKSQRPGSVEANSLSYHIGHSNQNWPSSNSNDKVSEVKSNEQNDQLLSSVGDGRQTLENSVVEQAGLDICEENTKENELSSRMPLAQPLYPDLGQSTQSLGERRDFAPRHLSCPAQATEVSDVSHAMVVSMSPSYTCVKDITPSSPLSPKIVSDSVKVSIPFQVHGQQQSSRPEQQSHVWSSSVSICVPFQVNENGAGVSALPSFDNQLLPTTLVDRQTSEQVGRITSVPILQEPLNSPRSNSMSVSESAIVERNTENTYPSAVNKMSSSEPSARPMKSSALLSVDVDKSVSAQDRTDGKAFTKPHSQYSPGTGKRKLLKENHTRDNQASKEQSSKTMGKEASKHKTTDKPVNSTALKAPTGGKPRAKSFNAGDKAKLTPGPSKTPPSPAGTPKSISPASSPKLGRRNATPKDVSKGRNSSHKTADPRKQENHNRPHSDPLIAERIRGKKKLPGVAANDAFTTGKARPDLEAVKSKVKDLEVEKLELEEKIQGMEHRLAVVPLLEKEKLHLQKQFNELVQENEKKSAELQSLNLESEKQRKEKDELQIKHKELMIVLENSQKEREELKNQNHLLEESNCTLGRENEENMQSIRKYQADIENLTTSNTALVLQESRSRRRISTLLQGLQSLKDSVIQLKDENKCLQSQIIENGSELVGRMRNCVNGLERVIDGLEREKTGKVEKETQVSNNIELLDKDTQCDELRSVHSEELEESKLSLELLKRRIDELESSKETSELLATPDIANEQMKPAVCLGCASLEEQLLSLKSNLESLKASLQKSESERDDAVEERNELRREAKYLKYVLSYREDVQSLQMTKQQNKELEKMESNLVEAEKKVIDLEDEVGRLHEEKQTLLLSILNLHSGHEVEDVKEEDEEENMASEESENNDENQDKGNMSEGSRTPDSISRREQLKFRFQLSLSESDYSYSSEQRTEGEEESESEEENMEKEITVQTGLHIKKIRTENKQLKTRLSEATEEKEELLSSLDKLCEEFDSLKANFDKLEEEHAVLSTRSKHDKEALQTRLREVEIDRENMRDSLRQVQDEKLALLKCLEMRNPEPMSPVSPLPQLDLDKIIARAQSFTREENKSSEPTSNEEDSEASLSSDAEDERRSNRQPNDISMLQTTPNIRARLEGQPEVMPPAAEDKDLASLVASIENDLGKLKERLNKRGGDTSDDVQDENTGKGVESRSRKPPPGERMLKRQASTVKSNLDRVCREKQHLQDEVESLRRYLLERRDSAMEIKKRRSHGSLKRAAAEVENHLEGIKTLQALLGKSDQQLRQSNEIISRLEAVNDETEDKLRDAELLQDDMRRAVQIANSFAMEEQEKAEKFMLQNQELLKTIEMLKSKHPSADQNGKDGSSKEKPKMKGKSKFQLTEAKGFNRSVSEDDGLYADDESTFTTEGESDFYSSRHSSIASESDFVTSPTSYEDNLDSLNSNVPAKSSAKSGDTETEGTSQQSSTADTSDVTDDETE